MLLYQIINTIRPSPIISYFANTEKCINVLNKYHNNYKNNDEYLYSIINMKDTLDHNIAHMTAFMYWDMIWNNSYKYNELQLFIPKFEYCTDNGAMIAEVGYRKCLRSMFSPINVTAIANLEL